jgi:hypothetical protein
VEERPEDEEEVAEKEEEGPKSREWCLGSTRDDQQSANTSLCMMEQDESHLIGQPPAESDLAHPLPPLQASNSPLRRNELGVVLLVLPQ